MKWTAEHLEEFLCGLPSKAELRRTPKHELRSRAAGMGLDVTELSYKKDLVEALSDPVQALRWLEGVRLAWVIETGESRQVAVEAHGASLVVSAAMRQLDVRPSVSAEDAELCSALRAADEHIVAVDYPGASLDELLELLEECLTRPDMDLFVRQAGEVHSQEIGGRVRWVPEDLDFEASGIISSHWDFLGPGEASPASDNPGTVQVAIHRDLLLGSDPAAEITDYVTRPAGRLTGAALVAALDTFMDHLVNKQTFSLNLPDDFDDQGIQDVLGAGRAAGLLRVNGEWWYQWNGSWTRERLPQAAGPVIDIDSVETVALGWAYLGRERPSELDLLVFPEADVDRRVALALLAGHKINGHERERVAVAHVHVAGQAPVPGVALIDDGTVSEVVGASHVMQLDLDAESLKTRAASGATKSRSVGILSGVANDASALTNALHHLRGEPAVDWTECQFGIPQRLTPETLPPPFVHVSDLAQDDERYLFLPAIGRDEAGNLWVDPRARARRAGMAQEDALVHVSRSGQLCVDTSQLRLPVPSRAAQHTLRAEERTG